MPKDGEANGSGLPPMPEARKLGVDDPLWRHELQAAMDEAQRLNHRLVVIPAAALAEALALLP
jgi:hypothetical protein